MVRFFKELAGVHVPLWVGTVSVRTSRRKGFVFGGEPLAFVCVSSHPFVNHEARCEGCLQQQVWGQGNHCQPPQPPPATLRLLLVTVQLPSLALQPLSVTLELPSASTQPSSGDCLNMTVRMVTDFFVELGSTLRRDSITGIPSPPYGTFRGEGE